MSRLDGATGKRLPFFGVAVACLLLLLAGLAGAKSMRDLNSARERERLLDSRLALTRQRIESLRARIDGLRSDPILLERIAREDLGFVRPKDIVIELPDDAPAIPPPHPPPSTKPPATRAAAPPPVDDSAQMPPPAPPVLTPE
ncbi:MAG TPA: septum formation initiator family protein [Thermoanaerobaculia bacterium]|nr:septum formation initiator family protein [Thermoanaerobaculia bacterium]